MAHGARALRSASPRPAWGAGQWRRLVREERGPAGRGGFTSGTRRAAPAVCRGRGKEREGKAVLAGQGSAV